MDPLVAVASAALLASVNLPTPSFAQRSPVPAADSAVLRLPRHAGPSGVAPAAPDTGRPRAIEYSDWYGRRLLIHRWGSYASLPLFGVEYWLGNKLLQPGDVSQTVRDNHRLVAGAIGVLFVTNTATGAWNLVESWKDGVGRKRRVIHTVLMLASDAGFALTGALAEDAREERSGASRHRAAALTSIGLSAAGTVMMWFWKE